MALKETPRLADGAPDWSKIGRRSKRKGKTYEAKVASLLQEFTGHNFRRVPSSGGFNKQGAVVRQESFCGDVICDKTNFKFCIEAKNRESLSFHSILVNPNTAAFSEWWYQCIEDAKSVKLLPILFFKPETGEDFVALTEAGMDTLRLSQESWEGPLNSTVRGDYIIPHFKLMTYKNNIITLSQTIKVPGQSKKQKIKIETTLPNPFIIRWKTLITHIKAEHFFKEI